MLVRLCGPIPSCCLFWLLHSDPVLLMLLSPCQCRWTGDRSDWKVVLSSEFELFRWRTEGRVLAEFLLWSMYGPARLRKDWLGGREMSLGRMAGILS